MIVLVNILDMLKGHVDGAGEQSIDLEGGHTRINDSHVLCVIEATARIDKELTARTIVAQVTIERSFGLSGEGEVLSGSSQRSKGCQQATYNSVSASSPACSTALSIVTISFSV